MPTLILCFHRVADPQYGGRSALAISPEDFRRTLQIVGARYRFVPLDEAAEPSKENTAVVTFDDGYADNLHTALPILQDLGIPATFFISTGFIDSKFLYPPDALDALFSLDPPSSASLGLSRLMERGYWGALDELAGTSEDAYWDLLGDISAHVRQKVLREDPLKRPMTAAELATLAASPAVTLGPHTVSHRRLSSLSPQEWGNEITESMSWLESHGVSPVNFFAYPFGQKRDMSRVVTEGMREQGCEPLSTLPVMVTRLSTLWLSRRGLPRLSVGPAEIPLLSMLVRVLPWVSTVAPLWLLALAVRRLIMSRL